jgi:hypothetical protein
MKFRLLTTLLALCLLFSWSTSTATVRVTDISLQKNSQFTEVTLTCDGATQFTHQIVEAAANKPYRIVVDVKDAVPGMDQASFKNLPSGSIKQIRTSQYSVDPEKVVRIVLDVAGALTYKVKGDGNTFTLQINTPTDKDFPKWSATSGAHAPTLASTKPAEPTKTQPTAKPDAAKKTDTQSTTVAAKTDSPKGMPAHPDKPATPAKSSGTEAEKKDLKLAAKPIDESKLLNKVNKPTNAAQAEEKAQPAFASESASKSDKPSTQKTTATPPQSSKPVDKTKQEQTATTSKTSTPGDKISQSTVKPAATTTSTSETSTAKRADSAAMPASKPSQSQPATTPAEQAIAPKAQKTALPETKVSKSPPYSAAPEMGNALTGNIATASAGTKPSTTSKQESVKDSSANTALSRSEEVRQRYLAGKEKGTTPEEAHTQGMATADTSMSQTPMTEIDKIRMKYKRGIRFVQNDQDEQQQAATESENVEEAEPQREGVGAYNEFLPEREIVVYQATGRPDPFMPLIEEATSSGKGGELPDVETLRLVGILQDKKVSRALFEDYNGYSYILRTGDRVKNGFVLGIEDTRVLFQIRQYGWNRQVAIDLESEK